MEGSFRGVDRGIVVMPEKFLDEAEGHVCNMKQGTPADGDAPARAIKALVKHLRWERRARYAEALHTVLVEMDPGYTEIALHRTGASTKDLLEGAHRLMRAVRGPVGGGRGEVEEPRRAGQQRLIPTNAGGVHQKPPARVGRGDP